MRRPLFCALLSLVATFTFSSSGWGEPRPIPIDAPDASSKVPATPHASPRQTFRDCPDCPEMVALPSGTFLMGSPADEHGRDETEGPQRKVSIRQFAAGKFDVTKAQWSTFVKATNRPTAEGCQWSFLPKDKEAKASWSYLGFEQGDSNPVVCVTWKDAHDYLDWLSQHSGHRYRLLSEAEWEYAARAGTTTSYPWGAKASHEFANYGVDDTYGKGFASGRDKWAYSTSPVGSFPPNAFGLYDMNGNVMQWVQDCFSSSLAGLPIDGSAYEVDVAVAGMKGDLSDMNGKQSCSYRIARGGDWGDPPPMIRSAYRNWAPGWPPGSTLANYSSSGLGIRVARDLE